MFINVDNVYGKVIILREIETKTGSVDNNKADIPLVPQSKLGQKLIVCALCKHLIMHNANDNAA